MMQKDQYIDTVLDYLSDKFPEYVDDELMNIYEISCDEYGYDEDSFDNFDADNYLFLDSPFGKIGYIYDDGYDVVIYKSGTDNEDYECTIEEMLEDAANNFESALFGDGEEMYDEFDGMTESYINEETYDTTMTDEEWEAECDKYLADVSDHLGIILGYDKSTCIDICNSLCDYIIQSCYEKDLDAKQGAIKLLQYIVNIHMGW